MPRENLKWNWPLICPPKFSLSLQRIKETYGNMLWSGWNALNGTRLRQDLTRLFRAGSPLLWQHGFATYVLFACKKGTWSQKVGCLLFTIFSTAQNSSLAVRTQHPHAPFFSINMYRSGRECWLSHVYTFVRLLTCTLTSSTYIFFGSFFSIHTHRERHPSIYSPPKLGPLLVMTGPSLGIHWI